MAIFQKLVADLGCATGVSHTGNPGSVTENKLQILFSLPVLDAGFPVAECRPRWELPGRLHFENFVCRNERIWTLRGVRAPDTPPRSANVYVCVSSTK